MRVLKVEPNKAPQVVEMSDDLEDLQNAVGGLIQAIYPHNDDTCIILNDEGKLIGLPMNRPLRDTTGAVYDVMVGTFLVVRAPSDSDSFESLTDAQIAKYTAMYAEPITDADLYKPLTEPRFELYF